MVQQNHIGRTLVLQELVLSKLSLHRRCWTRKRSCTGSFLGGPFSDAVAIYLWVTFFFRPHFFMKTRSGRLSVSQHDRVIIIVVVDYTVSLEASLFLDTIIAR